MKKTMHKAFTLVELIIVVVIIGILAAALLPRLQGAQGSARDAARKSDISQLGSAIVSYQANRGYFPLAGPDVEDSSGAVNKMVSASGLRLDLSTVVDLSSMPADPLKANQFTGTTAQGLIDGGQYAYAVMSKNQVPRGGFIVMARTETEGGANWVHSGDLVLTTTDITELKPCTSVVKTSETTFVANDGHGNCKYKDKAELRYLYIF